MHNIFLNVENKTNSSAPSVERYEVSITPKMWKGMESFEEIFSTNICQRSCENCPLLMFMIEIYSIIYTKPIP